jgi:hypothetical protein
MHLALRRHKSIARVAMGPRLAVRLYWMWRNGCEYSPPLEFGSYAGQLGTGHGVKQNTVDLMVHPAPSREGVRRSNHGRSFDRRDV